jgi:hypothetical protein
MTFEERFPRHPLRTKVVGDRVKIPKFPTDESRGYDYGTVFAIGSSDNLYVLWDKSLPYLARRTDIRCAIVI